MQKIMKEAITEWVAHNRRRFYVSTENGAFGYPGHVLDEAAMICAFYEEVITPTISKT